MILVTGSTGYIGRRIVAELLAANHPVRCLVPHEVEGIWQGESTPEVVVGNLLDEEVLFQAVSGVHGIIHLENAFWWGRPRDLERVEIVGTRNLIAAARAARVGRIVTLSHLGATPSSAFTLLRIKGMMEEMIRGSGLAYTIIRSGLVFGAEDAFINHIAMMLRLNPVFFLMPGQGEVVLNPIYIDDLIAVLLRGLESIEVVDETIEIGGPEYITLADLIATIMRVARMPRYVVSVPPYLMRSLTQFYGMIFRRTLMTPQWLDLLAASRTAHLGNTYNYFGIHPRRLEDTLTEYFPQKSLFFPALRYVFRRRPRGL